MDRRTAKRMDWLWAQRKRPGAAGIKAGRQWEALLLKLLFGEPK
jgi:hypothetical protein